jgi:phosphohistidine phosphatase SixA
MKLVLLRHASRSQQGPGDHGLSDAGHAQAEALIRHVSPSGSLPAPTRILSSPKLRARSTVEPLCTAFHKTLEIDKRIDEQSHSESLTEFENRVRLLIDELTENAGRGSLFRSETAEECLYIVSHLDWLEAALLALPTDLSDRDAMATWVTLEYRAFRFHDGIFKWVQTGHVIPPRSV